MWSFLLSLGLTFGSIDLKQLPAQQVEQIAKEVIHKMQADLHMKPSLTVTKRVEPTPLGALAYLGGKCVIVINTTENAWSQWGRFLNERNRDVWPQIVAASVAHEIGHCMRESREFTASYTLTDSTFQGLENTGNSSVQADMIFKQELFADAVAVLYTMEHAGENADKVIQAIVQAREHYGKNEPTHNTSAVLKRLLGGSMQRLDNEPVGSAAIRLLAAQRTD